MDDPHTAAATTGGGFHNDRKANLAGDTRDLLGIIRQGAVGAGHRGHPRALHLLLG